MQRFSLLILFALHALAWDRFDPFTFTPPKGYKTERTAESVVLKQDNGAQYCMMYLFRPRPSSGNHDSDAAADWKNHAAKHGTLQPSKTSTSTKYGWQVTASAGTASLKSQNFLILVTTHSRQNLTYAIVTYFNDMRFADDIAAFSNSVQIDEAPPATIPSGLMTMSRPRTNFDDGWVAQVRPDYVQVNKASTELRLYYVNDALEKARPNTVDVPEYYWAQIVARSFRASAPRKFVSVSYPPIYFMDAAGVDPQSGKPCFIAMKVIFAGGARVVLAISPNEATHKQLFPHPNDLDRTLTMNRFGLAAQDLTGTWVRNSGGGVEYYNAYTGNYAGMSASSSTDEFTFNPDGTYRSIHRNASTTNSGTKFSGLDYQGRFTVSDWELHATNRVDGKTKKFWARLEAIQNGYLLILTDSDYEPLQYVLFRKR
jgi:hypothetical protein